MPTKGIKTQTLSVTNYALLAADFVNRRRDLASTTTRKVLDSPPLTPFPSLSSRFACRRSTSIAWDHRRDHGLLGWKSASRECGCYVSHEKMVGGGGGGFPRMIFNSLGNFIGRKVLLATTAPSSPHLPPTRARYHLPDRMLDVHNHCSGRGGSTCDLGPFLFDNSRCAHVVTTDRSLTSLGSLRTSHAQKHDNTPAAWWTPRRALTLATVDSASLTLSSPTFLFLDGAPAVESA